MKKELNKKNKKRYRIYRYFEINFIGRDKNGSKWEVISDAWFLNKDAKFLSINDYKNAPRYRAVLGSFTEAKEHIDEIILLRKNTK